MITKEFITNEFKKQNLNCEMYVNYIFSKNLLNYKKGKSHHHILLKSIFGENPHIIQLKKKEHTRLHLLLIADNIEKIKNLEYSDELAKVCLAARITQYDKNDNRYIREYDKQFFEKYKKEIIVYSGSYISEFMKEIWNSNIEYKDGLIYRDYMKNSLFNFWNSEEGTLQKEINSDMMKILWKDNTFRENIISKLQDFWNSDRGLELRKISSERMKELWNNEDFRNNIINKLESFWNSDRGLELKEINSNRMKTLWSNEDFRKNVISKLTEFWKSEKGSKLKEFNSERMKELWKDEDFRNNIILKMSKYWNSEEGILQKELTSKRMKELWQDETYKNNIISKLQDFWNSERGSELRKISSERMKEFYKSEEGILQKEINSNHMKELWNDEDFRNNIIMKLSEYWNSEDGLIRKEFLSNYMTDFMTKLWNSKEIYKDNLTYKDWSIKYRNSKEYKQHMSELAKERFKDEEWLKKWSEIDSRFMKKLWSNDEYREYMLNCRKESGAYEKISKSKKKEWEKFNNRRISKKM